MNALLWLTLWAQEPAKTYTGSSEVGYRVLAGERGSFNTYRSVVNLGEGPRLLQFESRYRAPLRWLDDLRVTGANWGDPLNSVRINAEKAAAYRAHFQYRNLAYFNALPSFASPQLAKLGTEAYTTNQNSWDTRQRFWNLDLDLLPGHRLQPFFGAAQNTNRGLGVSPLVLDENSYPASSRVDSGYTVFRGGLRYELDQFHLTLEQGGATFSDGTSLINTANNLGNREAPLLGRQLSLQSASRLYDVTGNHLYSSADLTYSPVSWLDVSAEYYYSRPRSEVRFDESARGTILWLDSLRFVNGQQSLATGYANQPRSAGGLALEIRPFSRLRVLEAWQSERTHNSGSLALVTTLDSRALPPLNLEDRMVWRQNEQRLQAFYDVTNRFTIFGGHRYLWGEAEVRRATIAPGGPTERGQLRRHSVLGGFIFRPTAKLTLNGETEVGRGRQAYFRTSLQDFEQMRLRARYQLSTAWHLNARFARLDNHYPFASHNQQANVTLQWTRQAVSVMADYTRTSIRSDLSLLDPVLYRFSRSLYQDNADTGTLATDWRLPRKATLTLGGSLFRSSGTRPSRFYQPLARLRLPIATRASFLAEWRQASLGQALYPAESFGMHQFTVGLRIF